LYLLLLQKGAGRTFSRSYFYLLFYTIHSVENRIVFYSLYTFLLYVPAGKKSKNVLQLHKK
jgi:hypothetical protein